MELKKYDFRFDLIRAVAILMVIAIHSSALFCQVAINETGFGVNKILYSVLQIIFIAVPVFVMLSGALLLGKDEPLGVFFKKRLTRVMIPFLVWSVIVYALTYVQSGGALLDLLKD